MNKNKNISEILFAGHEATGVVVSVGSKVSIPIGSRIAIENHFYCGSCYTCNVSKNFF